MFKHTSRYKTVLMFSLAMVLSCPVVFAQGHQDEHNRRNGQGRGIGHGNRHYYHNGNWNRNGWYGWGIPAPVYSDGVIVASLPPGYTSVMVGGNPYFYGNGLYFRQVSSGGFAIVSLAN